LQHLRFIGRTLGPTAPDPRVSLDGSDVQTKVLCEFAGRLRYVGGLLHVSLRISPNVAKSQLFDVARKNSISCHNTLGVMEMFEMFFS
jgi:hypothetical protein